ncbi:MAG TPA: DoxX family protein [Terracidiphilus sp.]|nr:DoxX family protein [Terracidiphilus sp.]
MNALIWIGQIMLAAVFLATGVAKLLAYKSLIKTIEERRKTAPIRVTRAQGVVVGLLEIAGAIGVILPPMWTPDPLAADYLLVRAAAGCLALLMVGATIYHLRRRESASPAISAFLLALFVIVGRWPH